MSERRPRTERDRRRRTLGQNFLADPAVVSRIVAASGVGPGDLVVDIGAGTGALTFALADTGAEVWAVEPDPVWGDRLAERIRASGLAEHVRVFPIRFEQLRPPGTPYRVVANLPFGATTAILSRLLDDPRAGPVRADVLVQREVAVRHTATPPIALRTAAWAPWWDFRLGPVITRDSFRPRPSVDAALLTITARTPPLLPTRLAPQFIETLRPSWAPPQRRRPPPRTNLKGSRR